METPKTRVLTTFQSDTISIEVLNPNGAPSHITARDIAHALSMGELVGGGHWTDRYVPPTVIENTIEVQPLQDNERHQANLDRAYFFGVVLHRIYGAQMSKSILDGHKAKVGQQTS